MMFYSIFKFPEVKGVKPDVNFHEKHFSENYLDHNSVHNFDCDGDTRYQNRVGHERHQQS
jgi:hypothetical protein